MNTLHFRIYALVLFCSVCVHQLPALQKPAILVGFSWCAEPPNQNSPWRARGC
jgi:hypothetical protein